MKLKINHFNINVTNMDKSIEFYKKNLGLEIYRTRYEPNGEYILTFLTDEKKETFIELTWLKLKIGKYNLGDNEIHLAFTTNDFKNTYKLHKENNVIIYEHKDRELYFIIDPDGYWIEILPEKYE